MTDVVLGIDIGTSGVRIVARARDGLMPAIAACQMDLPEQMQSHVKQDPQIWWHAVEIAFGSLDLAGLCVRAIAVDGTSGTILPVDPDGTVLGLASMYNDHADSEDSARVATVAPLFSAARGATSPLARALKVKSRVVHQADWIMGQFCGRFDVTDENNALKSGYDPITRCWPSWISETGFDIRQFPKVVAAGTEIGTITKERALQFGLPSDVVLVTGTTDGCAAFLASGAQNEGDGVTSLGSTLTLKLLSATPVFAPQYGIYSHRIGDRWLAGGASNSGGHVLAQEFGKSEIAKLSERVDPEKPTGLDYYPLPSRGERFPVNDARLEPRMVPRPLDDTIYFQALLEGIAKIEALGYQRLAELGASPLTSIRSVGGGAANTKWTAIRLKTLNVPGFAPASEHAAMGVARLAWWGLGHAD